MSTSRETSAPFPPWINYLLEPVFASLDQAREETVKIGRELMRLDPDDFRRMREGVNGPENQLKLAMKRRGPETWIPLSRPSEEVSASETIASSDQTHPADLEWLASEQRRIDAQRDRELSELQRVLEERLGAQAVDSIIGGADPRDLCRAAGITVDADLERLLERLRGYQEDEG